MFDVYVLKICSCSDVFVSHVHKNTLLLGHRKFPLFIFNCFRKRYLTDCQIWAIYWRKYAVVWDLFQEIFNNTQVLKTNYLDTIWHLSFSRTYIFNVSLFFGAPRFPRNVILETAIMRIQNNFGFSQWVTISIPDDTGYQICVLTGTVVSLLYLKWCGSYTFIIGLIPGFIKRIFMYIWKMQC